MKLDYLKPEIACEKLIRTLRIKGISDERVLDAFRKVPRHRFVDNALFEQSYDDNALPIGLGQTISQPFIVALMTQLLELKQDEKILEIGTGSGFQAAILAQFSPRVYTIERHAELASRAQRLLRGLGYENIVFKVGDGTKGWQAQAPFDKIIVTAGAPVTPQILLNQLALNGRMVIPVGSRYMQELMVYHNKGNKVEQWVAEHVVFVPLIGECGWQQEQDSIMS